MELLEIKKALALRAEDVCRHLLPDGKKEGHDWAGGRLANGQGGSSLKVIVDGDKAGVWKDFGGDVGGSNLLELWVQVKGLEFQVALAEAKEWLGVRGVKDDHNLRNMRKKGAAKPVLKGLLKIANKAEAYLTIDRKIPSDVVELYRIGMSEDEGAIVFTYRNERDANAVEMLKFLALERDEGGKKKTWTSKDTPKVLYGKHTVRPGDRYIIITEGEIDAMSWRAVGKTGVSVPFGAKWEGKDGKDPNDEWIGNDWDFLEQFERIYICMDMDEEGRKAQASIVKRLGREICYVIELPVKDANEMLKAGRQAEMLAAFDKAKTLDPAALKNAGEYRDIVLDRMYAVDREAKRGIPLPWGKYPFHFRWNEWTVVTGQNGSGKTQLLGYLLGYFWQLGHSSCVASMEVPVGQTLEFYVSQTTGHKLPERAAAVKALDWLAGGFWFYDHVGEARWPDVLATFRYAYRRHGVRFFVIDSWMKLGIKGDDYDAQGEFCNALSDFVRDCDVHVFIVAHPRKLKNTTDMVGKMDVKGGGEITDQCHNVIVLWRNKNKEREIAKDRKFSEPEEKILGKQKLTPDAIMTIEKQKNDDGDEPSIDLWFIPACKQFWTSWRLAGRDILAPATPPAPEEAAAPAGPAETIDEDLPF